MAKKNRPISAPPIRTPVTVAPVTLRSRKSANGTSGFSVRVSVIGEGDQQRGGDGQRTGLEALDHAVDERDEAAGDGDRAERVEAAGAGR